MTGLKKVIAGTGETGEHSLQNEKAVGKRTPGDAAIVRM